MKIIAYLVFLFVSPLAMGQFDFKLYQDMTTPQKLALNSKLDSLTEFKEEDSGRIKKYSQTFNRNGYPLRMTLYNDDGSISGKKEFIYDSTAAINSIETYDKGIHTNSAEFKNNKWGLISSCKDYVYSPLDGEKTFVMKTLVEYNSNKTVSKFSKLEGSGPNAGEINYYNQDGVETKSIINMPGLNTTEIRYAYNKDGTEMLETHYENHKKEFLTIVHKYNNKREIERLDPFTSKKPFYWKYDNNGNLVETNEAVGFVVYYTYDSEGYLIEKRANAISSDINYKLIFKYEYQFR